MRTLGKASVHYVHLKGLGGLRRSGLKDSPNKGWKNEGFRNYADHMSSEEFQAQLETLLDLASEARTAIMCAEAIPWRCHRQLIADALVELKGATVIHIVGPYRLQNHRLTPFAKIEGGRLVYPQETRGD